jgi:hypothetical protein
MQVGKWRNLKLISMRKMLERTSGRARAKARSSQRWQKEKRVEKRQWERYRENGKAVTVVMESRTVGRRNVFTEVL